MIIYTQTLYSLFAYFASREHCKRKIHMLEMCDYTCIYTKYDIGNVYFRYAIESLFN